MCLMNLLHACTLLSPGVERPALPLAFSYGMTRNIIAGAGCCSFSKALERCKDTGKLSKTTDVYFSTYQNYEAAGNPLCLTS